MPSPDLSDGGRYSMLWGFSTTSCYEPEDEGVVNGKEEGRVRALAGIGRIVHVHKSGTIGMAPCQAANFNIT